MINYKENTITILNKGYSVFDWTTNDEVYFDTLEEAKHFIDTFLLID